MAGKIYLDVLLWVVAGLALGGIAYYVLTQPGMQQAGAAATQPPAVPNATSEAAAGGVRIDVVIINPRACPKCRDLGPFVERLREVAATINASVGTVGNLSADQGAELISKYLITRLPTLILTPSGPLNRSFVDAWESGMGSEESGGVLVLRDVYPPYYENGTVVGLVEGYAINASDCPQCPDTSGVFDYLAQDAGMVFSNSTVLDENDSAAQALIARHAITKLPALVLSADATAYPPFVQYLLPEGDITGGWFVLRNNTPPYVDLLANHSVRGLVEEILIVNTSCADCYDAGAFSAYVIGNTGLTVVNTTSLEAGSAEGRALIRRYNITGIPTVLYSPEASAYGGFTEMWLQNPNTVESDGWYVFRAFGEMGVVYQNVTG